MSVGLVGNAAELQQQREMGSHYDTLSQPIGGSLPQTPAPVTAQQALMQGSDPIPPHATQQEVAGVSFEQAVSGLHTYYRRFRAVEAAYNTIHAVLSGKQDPPVISLPTATKDEHGNQIIYELDLKQTLPERVSEDERVAALKKQLTPWNNYFVREYHKWITQIARSSAAAAELLESPEPGPEPDPGTSQQAQPGTRVIRAPSSPPAPPGR